MWSDKQPWWVKKAKENKVDKTHWKNWCVVKVIAQVSYINGTLTITSEAYKPCAKLNAPQYYTAEGKIETSVTVDNLTKHEAYAVAKGLNFLDGEINGNK